MMNRISFTLIFVIFVGNCVVYRVFSCFVICRQVCSYSVGLPGGPANVAEETFTV